MIAELPYHSYHFSMNILVITETTDQTRGYGRFCQKLVSNLKNRYPRDVNIRVLVLRGEHIFKDEKAVLVRNRKLGLFINPLIILWYARGYQIIHCLDGYPYGLYGALVKSMTKKKLFISMMGTYSVEPLYHAEKIRLMKWAYEKADALSAISRFTKDEVLKVFPSLHIDIIIPGVECEKNKETDGDVHIVSERYILTVGTLSERKGYHISLRAFATVRKNFSYLKYVIVGSPQSEEYMALLDSIIQEENISQDVVFLKNLSDTELAAVYRYADVFILTPVNVGHHFEGYGMVYAEAGCFSVPVIGTKGSGAESAVEDGITGLLVPQNDPEAAAGALQELLIDDKRRISMGKHNAAFAKENHWSSAAEKYFSIYSSI